MDAVYYMVLQPHGFSGLSVGLTDVLDMDIDLFVDWIEKLSIRREQEAAEYEKARAATGNKPPA